MKVMTGSFGTLGIITEATFKVRPIPENYMLALASFDDPGAAFDAAADAGNRAPLVNIEVLSREFSEAFGRPGKFSVLAGFAGTNAEAKEQRIRMSNALRAGECEIATGLKASTLYERLRDVDFLDTATVAQIAVPPAALKCSVAECGAGFRAHAGSGVAQIFTDLQETGAVAAAVTRWRTVAHAARGNLRVMRIRSEVRDAVQIFDQPPAPAMALMRRLKSAFDPDNIFNPGCFVGGL
jgi:glycolate oxidase FAD binding subunit